jgi:hypothetical protein
MVYADISELKIAVAIIKIAIDRHLIAVGFIIFDDFIYSFSLHSALPVCFERRQSIGLAIFFTPQNTCYSCVNKLK